MTLFTVVVSLISFLLTVRPGVKKHACVREGGQNWKPALLGYLYVLCTVALFFRSVSWREGPMNLEVSKAILGV